MANLSTRNGIDQLPEVEDLLQLLRESGYHLNDEDIQYIEALRSDLIQKVRSFVGEARSSGLRREAFSEAIAAANQSLLFGPDVQLPGDTQLLRDVDTRWSSQFLMIDRYIEVFPVS